MMKFIKLTSESFQKCLKGIIVACSLDGRMRVFINEQYNEENKEDFEYEYGIKKDDFEQKGESDVAEEMPDRREEDIEEGEDSDDYEY